MRTIRLGKTDLEDSRVGIDICPENIFEIKDMDGRNISVQIAEESCFTYRVCQVRCLRT